VRFDKWILVIGASAVAAAVVLGALAGALAGVLTALAGAVFAVLWQFATARQSKVQAADDLLREAARNLAPPRLETDSPVGYLRAEAEIVQFRPRAELDVLRDWLVSPRQAGVQLVTGEAGSGKTRLALQLASESGEQYGWALLLGPSRRRETGRRRRPSRHHPGPADRRLRRNPHRPGRPARPGRRRGARSGDEGVAAGAQRRGMVAAADG